MPSPRASSQRSDHDLSGAILDRTEDAELLAERINDEYSITNRHDFQVNLTHAWHVLSRIKTDQTAPVGSVDVSMRVFVIVLMHFLDIVVMMVVGDIFMMCMTMFMLFIDVRKHPYAFGIDSTR